MAGSPLAAGTIAALLSLPMTGCASLPSLEGRADSRALAGTADTFLGRVVAAAGQRTGAGIHALREPRDAFAARAALATAAERSLDVQYYIWREDPSGTLLFESLWRAAGRGVRVRLLLDGRQHLRNGRDARGAGRAPEDRGAPLQPARPCS